MLLTPSQISAYKLVLSTRSKLPLALPQPQQYLRPGLTLAVLQRIAGTRSDTEAAQRMQQVKRKLFDQLRPPVGGPWK